LSPVNITKANLLDLNEIYHIEKESFTTLWSKSLFLHEILSEGSLVLTAKDGRKVAGYLCAMYVYDEAHITNVAVRISHRRQGIGSLLLDEAIRRLSKNPDIVSLSLEARVSNFPAIELYKKFGFEPIGVRPRYYSDGEDALIMRRGALRGEA